MKIAFLPLQRREFIGLVSGADSAFRWPMLAGAQDARDLPATDLERVKAGLQAPEGPEWTPRHAVERPGARAGGVGLLRPCHADHRPRVPGRVRRRRRPAAR